MLNQGLVPTVLMKNCMETRSLSLRLSTTEPCLVRQYPEDLFRLQELAKDLQLPYRGCGTAAFPHQAIVALLRRQKETATIAESCCYLCGGEAEEIDHTPQQARSTEKHRRDAHLPYLSRGQECGRRPLGRWLEALCFCSESPHLGGVSDAAP